MMSCEQLEKHEAQVFKETKEQKWKKVIELLSNRTAYGVKSKYTFHMASKHQTQRELQKRPRQHDDFQKAEMQRPRQQDDLQKEIQAATNVRQST